MRRLLPFVLVSLCGCMVLRAQQDAAFSQYFMTMGYYNPATVGGSGDMSLSATSKMQWLGIEDNTGDGGSLSSPVTFALMVDMPVQFIGREHGVGMLIVSDAVGLFRTSFLSGQYAYRKKLWGGVLGIGLQVGLASVSFAGEDVYIPKDNEFYKPAENDDAIPTTQVSGRALDISAGLYYTRHRFYAGIGALHVTQPEISLDENAYTNIVRGFNFIGGYNIQMENPLFELHPSVFLKTDLLGMQTEATARMTYNKMFNGGISWRMNESVIVLLGATIKGIQVGYAYDYPISPIRRVSSGSHELLVRYHLKVNKPKAGKNGYKSVRIL